MEVIIHVGLPKTGTTFLQEEIFRKLNLKFIRSLSIVRMATKEKKILISHEGLSIEYDKPAYKKYIVAEYLKKLFPEAKIIVGIREKESWLKSIYSQYIREGGTKTFEEFYREFDKEHLNFEKYISYLKSLFDEVFIYRFEDLKNNKYEVVKEICNFIGEPIPKFSEKKYRISLKPYQLKTMRAFNKFPLPQGIKVITRYAINRITHSQPQGDYEVDKLSKNSH